MLQNQSAAEAGAAPLLSRGLMPAAVLQIGTKSASELTNEEGSAREAPGAPSLQHPLTWGPSPCLVWSLCPQPAACSCGQSIRGKGRSAPASATCNEQPSRLIETNLLAKELKIIPQVHQSVPDFDREAGSEFPSP